MVELKLNTKNFSGAKDRFLSLMKMSPVGRRTFLKWFKNRKVGCLMQGEVGEDGVTPEGRVI